ncbi:hypothetical protein BACCIP111899_03789 [Bacillus rhizoplanae]|uniref:Cytoplasmic protein n=1 Tax=Bacillus rhizoplanae TaxID=2880966 RepID=A0ABM8YFG1_9BACI|nr:polymer-forming cytoskeletal protein [Bacillus rhizoplanae]CAG9614556.1 hypothetical protein BACCIP111899_03789 [Bacillus rhizoplanae]
MKTHDLLMNGYGTANGGQFRNVQLNGKGTVNGDLECIDFECNGSGHVNGDLKAEKITISGSGKINGKIDALYMSIEGSGSIYEDATVKKMKISGKGTVAGNISGEDMNIRGKAIIDGGCTITGMLNAGKINIVLRYEHSSVEEIGGEKITVRKKSSFFPFSKHGGFLKTRVIEGDEIYLEYTKADVVRGNNVTIGPECEISVVEYHESYKNAGQSLVKEYKQI